MDNLSKFVEDVAGDLWHRFRAISMVIDQADRFVGMGPANEAIQAESHWLKSLPEKREEIDEIAKDLVLRAFRAALQPDNYAILQKLVEQSSRSFSDLMQTTELNRLSVSERVNDLIQVGLADKDVQTGQVRATNAAHRILTILQKTQDGLSNLIVQKLPD